MFHKSRKIREVGVRPGHFSQSGHSENLLAIKLIKLSQLTFKIGTGATLHHCPGKDCSQEQGLPIASNSSPSRGLDARHGLASRVAELSKVVEHARPCMQGGTSYSQHR